MGTARKILVTILLALLAWQDVKAVVNTGNTKAAEDESKVTSEDDINKGSENINVNSIAASTEDKENRREGQLDTSYGAPFAVSADSYLSSGQGNLNLPVPVYGVPDSPSNNIIYPQPPPDIPPPITGPLYGLPNTNYGLPQNQYLSPPPKFYGTPNVKFEIPSFSPRKPFGSGRIRNGPPRFQYGPPGKPLFNTKYKKFNSGNYKFGKPHSIYGPPSGSYKKPAVFNFQFAGDNHVSHGGSLDLSGLANTDIQTQVVNLDISGGNTNAITAQFGTDVAYPTYGVPQAATSYGPPDNDIVGLKPLYGPPQPSPHPRPPHPGAPAPPTPPDIKYDGWQPIPGLISRVPTASYGVPVDEHSTSDLNYNKDLIPPPPADTHVHDSAGSHGSLSSIYVDSSLTSQSAGVKDSYGAPLNIVTGSGAVVRTSGNDAHAQGGHHSHHSDISGFSASGHNGVSDHDEQRGVGSSSLSAHSQHSNINYQYTDTYSTPPINSYSLTGPYSASQGSHNSIKSYKSNRNKGFPFSSGSGLIPPSGLYGVPPSSQYGIPLFSGSENFKNNPPKYPVSHREPVPSGIFDSIINKYSSNNNHGHSESTYLPPPVQDFPRPNKVYGVPTTSNSFGGSDQHSLSFQNNQYDSSNSFNLNLDGGSSGISSYNVPLNTLDASYNVLSGKKQLNNDVVSLDLSHPGVTIDLTQDHSTQSLSVPHDCNQKLQQGPSLSYGVPSANTYTASLSSLTTNIGGASLLPVPEAQIGYHISEPHNSYGVPDLSTAHTQQVNSALKTNLIESESDGKEYGKSVAQSFGASSELIQSQSIDLNNIPLQGALGSYSLQIQSADGKSNGIPHGQVLNDGLLQSILAAIEQPQKGGPPVIQLQKSLEKQDFVTNDTISSVVEQLADAEIRHSSQLAKDMIEKSSELYDSKIEHSSPELSIIAPPSNQEETSESRKVETHNEEEKQGLPFLEDRGIALYFNKNAHLIKKTKEENEENVNSE